MMAPLIDVQLWPLYRSAPAVIVSTLGSRGASSPTQTQPFPSPSINAPFPCLKASARSWGACRELPK